MKNEGDLDYDWSGCTESLWSGAIQMHEITGKSKSNRLQPNHVYLITDYCWYIALGFKIECIGSGR